MSEIKNILPSLTFLMEERPDMLENYSKDMFHFTNKMINTLNPSTPICIPPKKPQKEIPYISLSTVGVETHEIDYNANAANIAPIKTLRALFEGRDAFLNITNDNIEKKNKEREDLNKKFEKETNEKELEKILKALEINKITLFYLEKDKQSFDDINEKIGVESDFFKSIFKNEKFISVPTLTRQILIYDETNNDYLSITPVSSFILNKKIAEEVVKIKLEHEDYKIRNADGKIGGSKPQNVTTFSREAEFKLFVPHPKTKDLKYKKLWKIVLKGFYLTITKNQINNLIYAINNLNEKGNTLNKDALQRVVKNIYYENLKVANNISEFISEAIRYEIIKDKNHTVNLSDIDILQNIVENKKMSENLFNGIFLKFNEKKSNKWLFKNKKQFKNEITNELLNKIKSKLFVNKKSLTNEIENLIKKTIEYEVMN